MVCPTAESRSLPVQPIPGMKTMFGNIRRMLHRLSILPIALASLALLTSAHSAQGQNLEVSGVGGFGVAERDGYGIPGVASRGVTFAWPYTSAHKVQFDYAFGHIERTSFTTIVTSSQEATWSKRAEGAAVHFSSSAPAYNTKRTTRTKW